MTLGLEICNRYETNVVNTARDCLRLADDIGADNVMIHLDTYHMNIEEDDFVTPVSRLRRPAGLRPHRREPPRATWAPGTSTSRRSSGRWPRSSYTRADHLRIASRRPSSPRGCRTTSPIWRNLWDDGADLARHAHQFITEQLFLNRVAA